MPKADIKQALIDIINSETGAICDHNSKTGRWDVTVMVPLRDGTIVTADAATAEQWSEAIEMVVESAIEECTPRLEAAIDLIVSNALYRDRGDARTVAGKTVAGSGNAE